MSSRDLLVSFCGSRLVTRDELELKFGEAFVDDLDEEAMDEYDVGVKSVSAKKNKMAESKEKSCMKFIQIRFQCP